jgi:DNA-binding HxlR family transcriptional regulator
LLKEAHSLTLKDHLDRWGMKACPIDTGLKLLGQRYALHIMRNMILLKQYRFNQFLHSIEGINTKTLSKRLHELEHNGLIKRKVIPGKPDYTEYSLTKKGRDVEKILWDVGEFSIMYEPNVVFRDRKARTGDEMKAAFGTERLSEICDLNEV